jgi:hypothetical protein
MQWPALSGTDECNGDDEAVEFDDRAGGRHQCFALGVARNLTIAQGRLTCRPGRSLLAPRIDLTALAAVTVGKLTNYADQSRLTFPKPERVARQMNGPVSEARSSNLRQFAITTSNWFQTLLASAALSATILAP